MKSQRKYPASVEGRRSSFCPRGEYNCFVSVMSWFFGMIGKGKEGVGVGLFVWVMLTSRPDVHRLKTSSVSNPVCKVFGALYFCFHMSPSRNFPLTSFLL